MGTWIYKSRSVSLLLLSLCSMWFASAWSDSLPNLPAKLRQGIAPNKLVLLDFVTEWFSTCQKMEPQVQRITRPHKNLAVVKLDIEKNGNDVYANQFNITGTPTYILFSSEGKPLFHMKHYITSTVLENSLNAIMQNKKVTGLPSSVQDKIASTPWTLLALQPKECASCEQSKQHLDKLGTTGGSKLAITHVSNNLLAQTSKSLGISMIPSYVLLDRQGREFYRHTGAFNPRHVSPLILLFMEFNLAVR